MDASAYAAIIIAITMSIIAYGAYIIGKKNDKKIFSNMEEAYEVFKKNTGFEPTLVNIKYSRNIPEVQEVEL